MLLSLVLVLVLGLLVGVFFFIKSSPVFGAVVSPNSTPSIPRKYRCHVATKDTCMVTKHTCPSFSKPKAVGWLLMRANDDDGDDGDDGSGAKEAKCTQLIDEDGCNQYTCYTPVFTTKEECEATCLVSGG